MHRSPSRAAFTLVELLVALAVLVLLSLMLVSMTNSTSNIWRSTRSKIEQFRSASDAFEAMTRRIGQATLNTAWEYDNVNTPTKYQRQSHLRFLAGPTESILAGQTAKRPGHSIFFQATLGFVDDQTNFGGLPNLLNTWGYYLEFNKEQRPAFLETLPNGSRPPDRYRYRLMELMQPANHLSLYKYTNNPASTAAYTGTDWISTAVDPATMDAPVHVLAENVIALILLPKLSKTEDASGIKLSPHYKYDSTVSNSDPALDSKNQLPPVVQMTLVAIDEPSAIRVARGSSPPSFDADLSNLFQDASSYDADMKTLQDTLTAQHINFRVFTSNISIRAAKWSRN